MKLRLDDERVTAGPLAFRREGGEGVFVVPPLAGRADDLPREVRVAVIGDQLCFFERRSSAQKQVLTLLGAASE